jgi:hypothetical protein
MFRHSLLIFWCDGKGSEIYLALSSNEIFCVEFLQLELYFAGDDDVGPFSARNELESLNLLFKIVNKLLVASNADAKEVLQMLQNDIVERLRSVGKADDAHMVSQTQNHDSEDSLLKWGEYHGVKSKLRIACKSPYNLPINHECFVHMCNSTH